LVTSAALEVSVTSAVWADSDSASFAISKALSHSSVKVCLKNMGDIGGVLVFV
jgi:hypothetical protein